MIKKKRDYEKFPVKIPIEKFIESEIKPFLNKYIYNKENNKIGYEISLTKEFYKFENFRSLEDIENDIFNVNNEIKKIENSK